MEVQLTPRLFHIPGMSEVLGTIMLRFNELNVKVLKCRLNNRQRKASDTVYKIKCSIKYYLHDRSDFFFVHEYNEWEIWVNSDFVATWAEHSSGEICCQDSHEIGLHTPLNQRGAVEQTLRYVYGVPIQSSGTN